MPVLTLWTGNNVDRFFASTGNNNANISFHKKMIIGGCNLILFLIIILSSILSNVFVDGRRSADFNIEHLAKRKRTVKTIKGENGDIIHCVDIYQQPALSHPLLQNHSLQMKPSLDPTKTLSTENSDLDVEFSMEDLLQDFRCPETTIPIIRSQTMDNSPIPVTKQKLELEFQQPPIHEYATVSISNSNYIGAQGILNIWNPKIFDSEFSISQLWFIATGGDRVTNTMEVGWMAKEDNKTRLFIYWTRDNYQNTGCFNLACPGFVQTNRKLALGSAFRPVSTFRGKQYELQVKIYKDNVTGNWWLMLQNQVFGYWPKDIFTSLRESANLITWGGEVMNYRKHGRHTSTQMGSGHFPSEGNKKASYIRNIGYLDQSRQWKDATNVVTHVSRSSCYNLHIIDKFDGYRTHFYYGGPGYSGRCY
ncbi:protein neprosin-like [Rutidosis leptorrhynchoides]|uniref:protein neprosin-like n=1 Tax=Rutidosis leptorrhynchoides TaxID=125765 RepID=UPI003A9A4B82